MIGKILTFLSAALVVGAALAQSGPQCASTPSGAVLRGLGLDSDGESASGYRVHDVVFDPATRHAFVRVEMCGHTERPMLLLPFVNGELASDESRTVKTQRDTAATITATPTVKPGTVVEVAMLDPRVSLTVQGRLLQSALIGSDVDVQLLSPMGAADGPEQPRHIRGRLTTATRVEVRP